MGEHCAAPVWALVSLQWSNVSPKAMFLRRERVWICGRKAEGIHQFAFCLCWLIHLEQDLLNLMFKWLFQQYRKLCIFLPDASDTRPQFPFSFVPGRWEAFLCVRLQKETFFFPLILLTFQSPLCLLFVWFSQSQWSKSFPLGSLRKIKQVIGIEEEDPIFIARNPSSS